MGTNILLILFAGLWIELRTYRLSQKYRIVVGRINVASYRDDLHPSCDHTAISFHVELAQKTMLNKAPNVKPGAARAPVIDKNEQLTSTKYGPVCDHNSPTLNRRPHHASLQAGGTTSSWTSFWIWIWISWSFSAGSGSPAANPGRVANTLEAHTNDLS